MITFKQKLLCSVVPTVLLAFIPCFFETESKSVSNTSNNDLVASSSSYNKNLDLPVQNDLLSNGNMKPSKVVKVQVNKRANVRKNNRDKKERLVRASQDLCDSVNALANLQLPESNQNQ